jgi:putative methionine-R-sulfoxide reductase with GAF domain
MLKEELIPQVQRRIAAHQAVLTDIFRELLKDTNADLGFLAFEDINGNLAIVANKGEFWYLSRDAGATGRAVTSGRPSITEPSSDSKFRETSSKVYSELIYPIAFSDHVIGAILLDNTKKVAFEAKNDYPIVERYIKQICAVLGGHDPWTFRTWWQEQQRLKRTSLFDAVHSIVHAVLDRRAKEVSDSMIEARVEHITHDGNLLLHNMVIGQMLSNRKSDRDTVASALRTGRRIERPAETKKYECLIPFPPEGPVLGIVTLFAETKESLPDEVVDEIESRMRELDYQHYAPALPSGHQGAEHYFNLVLAALTAPSSPAGARSSLETMARQASELCGEELQILVSFGPGTQTYKSDSVIITEEDVVVRELGAKVKIERFFCQVGREWLRCPVFVRDRLRGVVKVKNQDISRIYNSEIIVVVAILVAELLDRMR